MREGERGGENACENACVWNLYTPHKQLISYTFLTHLRIDAASFMWTSSASYSYSSLGNGCRRHLTLTVRWSGAITNSNKTLQMKQWLAPWLCCLCKTTGSDRFLLSGWLNSLYVATSQPEWSLAIRVSSYTWFHIDWDSKKSQSKSSSIHWYCSICKKLVFAPHTSIHIHTYTCTHAHTNMHTKMVGPFTKRMGCIN